MRHSTNNGLDYLIVPFFQFSTKLGVHELEASLSLLKDRLAQLIFG
jgi:hypothetical protein